MTLTYDVIATGSYTLDLVFTGLPCLPAMGREVVATGFDIVPGEGYTSAVAMHRLGLQVGWAADFGNDDLSLMALAKARLEGLDEALFVHHARSFRRLSIAASFPQDRSFITYYDPDPPVPAPMKALPRVTARVFYIPGFVFGKVYEAGLALVRARRMKIVMDGNSGPGISLANPAVHKAAANVDILLPNAFEARMLTGEDDLQKAVRALGKVCPLVVVKDGPGGAYAVQGDQVWHAPAIPITPLDTTGAGDCFNAGFLRAWLDERPMQECLRWGNISGGLSTLARGGTGQRVTLKEIQTWLEKTKHRAERS